MPSRGPKRRRNCSVTLAFSGDPQQGDKIRSGYLTHAFSRAYKSYVTLAILGVPNKGEHNQKWLPQPCLLGGPKDGCIAM